MKCLSTCAKATLVFLILLCGYARSDAPVSNIIEQLDVVEKKLEWLDHRLNLERWKFYTTGTSDSLVFYQDLYRYLLAQPDLFINLRQGPDRQTDTEQSHRLQLFLAKTLPDRVRFLPEISKKTDSLVGMIGNFRAEREGKMLTISEISKSYRSSRNRMEREWAFRTVNAVGDSISYGLTRIFELRNDEAVKLGYKNYFDMVASQCPLGPDGLLQLISRIDSLTQENFAIISRNALKSVGVKQLEIWDLDYAHSQINQRADDFLNFDDELRMLDNALERMGFEVEQLPIYYSRATTVDNQLIDNVFEIKVPYDVRVLLTEQNKELRLQQLLKATGQALYSVHIAEAKPVYNFLPQKTWQLAMAEIMSLLAIDSLWLNDFANMPVDFIEQYRRARKDQELISVRKLLINLRFEYEAYLDPNQDLNRLYWDLLQQYTGLLRHEDVTLWASQIEFLTRPLISINQLLSKIIAAQTVSYMNDYLGQPVDDLRTSAFLIQNYYRFGSRYSWPELLERGTGEKLNPEHLSAALSH